MTPVAVPASEAQHRLRRLRPVAHEMIAGNLVYLTSGGTYALHDDVQALIAEMLASVHPPSTQVYIGRPCQQCGNNGVTKTLGGIRHCSDCRQGSNDSGATSPPAVRRWLRNRQPWHLKAG